MFHAGGSKSAVATVRSRTLLEQGAKEAGSTTISMVTWRDSDSTLRHAMSLRTVATFSFPVPHLLSIASSCLHRMLDPTCLRLSVSSSFYRIPILFLMPCRVFLALVYIERKPSVKGWQTCGRQGAWTAELM